MLAALAEAGVVPDMIVGTSVGALNGAWVAARAGRQGVTGLGELWCGLRRAEVFPSRPVTGLMGLTGRRGNLVSDAGLRAILDRSLRFDRLEDAPVPLHVVATDVLSGRDVLLSSGDARTALLASAAIPGIFPPVSVEGRILMDGGVVNNTPISHALALGADTVWVLPCGYACALEAPPPSALAMALHGISMTIQQRLLADVERHSGEVDLRVLAPPCPARVPPNDFSRAPVLIDAAYRLARGRIGAPGRDNPSLALHDHLDRHTPQPGP